MTTNNIYSEPWCDLVFENRNQSYGAYQIRKVTNPNTFISFVGTLVLLGSFVLIPRLFEYFTGAPLRPLPLDEGMAVVVNPFIIPDEKEEEQIPRAKEKPAQAKVVADTPPVITKEAVAENVHTQDELKAENTGSSNQDGTEKGSTGTVTDPGDGDKPIIEPKEPEPSKPYNGFELDAQPAFFGGDEGLQRFFNKNLKYPPIEKENGIEGTVYIEFVIAETGEVTEIEVKRATTKNFEKEATRVIQKMPKWNPGIRKGKAVASKMVLPIRFKLN